MEIRPKLASLLFFLLSASCTPGKENSPFITDVYIDDFQTENMAECAPSDVDLDNNEATRFFSESRKVPYKIIHDHYNVAPCHIEGVLTKNNKVCEWEIQASAIGSIKCDDEVSYYVCDTCEDLFK